MKSWKWLTTILIVAILGVYYILGTDYLKERRRSADLTSQINQATMELALIPVESAGILQRLETARAELAAAEGAFTGETDDVIIVERVLRLAEESGVKAIPLSTSPWAVENIQNRDYSVFRLVLEATGNYTSLRDFTRLLETSDLNTSMIRYLRIDRTLSGTSENVTADIDIAVYTLTAAVE
jgi:hypothetical protein